MEIRVWQRRFWEKGRGLRREDEGVREGQRRLGSDLRSIRWLGELRRS
jgi:hypothetical protein